MICPKCKHLIPDAEIARHFAAHGGRLSRREPGPRCPYCGVFVSSRGVCGHCGRQPGQDDARRVKR